MKLGELLKSYRAEHKLSMDAFCELSDLTKGYISMLEKNEHPKSKKPIIPSYETIEKIAKGMHISVENLIDMLDDDQEIQINATPPAFSKSKIQQIYDQLHPPRQEKVLTYADNQLKKQNNEVSDKVVEYDPRKRIVGIVDFAASAGTGVWQDENLGMEVTFYEDDMAEDYDSIGIVMGHSMEPVLQNGDYLFVKITTDIPNGAISIWKINGENYVKKLRMNGKPYLESLNPDYDDILLTETDDIRPLGVVVDIYREEIK